MRKENNNEIRTVCAVEKNIFEIANGTPGVGIWKRVHRRINLQAVDTTKS
jgi:hypothetical protein